MPRQTCRYRVQSNGIAKTFLTFGRAKAHAKKRFLSGKLVSIHKECKRFTLVDSYNCGRTFGGGFACEKDRPIEWGDYLPSRR